MHTADDDEDPLLSVSNRTEVTVADNEVGKCIGAHKEMTKMDILKPITKNPEEHAMSSDKG